MHRAILPLFVDFKDKFLEPYLDNNLKILEVGSRLENSRLLLRDYMVNDKWEFTGLDIDAGRNVDVVSDDPYKYPFDDNAFDVVISTNVIEHVQDMSRWIKEVARVSNNLVWIVVPNSYKEHGKADYWRIMPQGMEYLLNNIAGLEVIDVGMSIYDPGDTFGIAKKI